MAVPKLGSAMRFLMAGGAGAVLLSPAGVALADKADPKKKEQGPLFDPEALERGAKALREINSSPHAKQVIQLTREQEVTKQQELKVEEAKYGAQAAAAAQEQERVRWEAQSKYAQEEAQRKAQLAQYNDELARKRQAHEHELQRQRNAELVQLQAETAARQEAERLRIEQQIQAERRAAEQYKLWRLRRVDWQPPFL
ncbi:hypothetical protein MNEG_15875 [Monoraphidium neglectum]|uniref:ATPase family AAA domain-containing protein n=1 Tax=Monoraphidium neglectum TaxID=145388 RepID=A0A0D2IVZ0_9CHLO|nr:hypothetical protein MNEG_15875 [Monoraphidium neglectum]KIY92087.1 hypothetical protein MNEG_15875 [Monoraphidium neglectum]|eukprot:XP_013891107.1 hypothetical protein MNEG_15875 [Monoraphidium neglectum]